MIIEIMLIWTMNEWMRFDEEFSSVVLIKNFSNFGNFIFRLNFNWVKKIELIEVILSHFYSFILYMMFISSRK